MTEEELTEYIEENKYHFKKMVQNAVNETNETRQIQLCGQAAIYAVNYPPGQYNSKPLEDTLVTIAQKHSIELSDTYEENSYLHVLTTSYASGGHTRVCERWMAASPEGQKHSALLISQGDRPIPQSLRDSVENKSGSFTVLDSGLPLDKALELREIASKFQHIILHVHMHDVVPLLAFGTSEFKRPIVFYNHADHIFWLGCALADLNVNLRTVASEMSESFRGIQNNHVLPLPVLEPSTETSTIVDKVAVKKELGFAGDSKVIITIASAYKYKPFFGMNFIETVEKILAKNSDAVVLAIGPSQEEDEWRAAFERTNGRINAIGVVPYAKLDAYIQTADIALASFPLGSHTALLDMAGRNVPCVSMDSPANSLDPIDESGILCKTTDDLVSKTLELLDNPNVENKFFEIIKRDHFPTGFSERLVDLYKVFPVKHEVHEVVQDNRNKVSPFEFFIAENFVQNQKSSTSRIRKLVRKAVYLYVRFVFPHAMPKKLYDYLTSRAVL